MYHLPRIQHEGLKEVTHGEYTLVRYIKPLQDPALSAYRSVVYKGNQLVAFSPPKSIPFQDFCTTTHHESAVAREFVDGTMLYVWFDQNWHVSTRSCLHADKIFRRGADPVPRIDLPILLNDPPTPQELFAAYVAKYDEAYPEASFYNSLRRDCTYVFSLLDPSSFNVVKPTALEVYLVSVYRITTGNMVDPVELDQIYPELKVSKIRVFLFDHYLELQQQVEQRPFEFKGLMFYNKTTGQRSKVMNPAYLNVHVVLSAKPNFNEIMLEHVLAKTENKIVALNESFVENANALKRNLARFINTLYTNYIECFVRKEKAHKDYNAPYRVHLYALHGMYLQMRHVSIRINKKIVTDYVWGLKACELTHALAVH
jgi:hypothetical protein